MSSTKEPRTPEEVRQFLLDLAAELNEGTLPSETLEALSDLMQAYDTNCRLELDIKDVNLLTEGAFLSTAGDHITEIGSVKLC